MAVFNGDSTNNNLTGTEFDDQIAGLAGNDTLSGLAGADSLDGGQGNDSLLGGEGADTLLGGTGADTLVGGAGNDTLDGGTVTDTLNLTDLNFVRFDGATTGVVVDLVNGTAQDGQGGTDTLANINFVVGTQYDDSITGTSGGLFEHFEAGAGNDTIDGGTIDPATNSHNRVSYQFIGAAVTVDLAAGTATGETAGNDTLININFVRGSAFADTLLGSDTTAHIESFDGQAGNDTVDGKGGIDQYRTDGATTGAVINLYTGTAQDGQGGTDTLLNIENARGGNWNDTLVGSDGANVLQGMNGDDVLQGRAGDDNLQGGAGNDALYGGTGNDTLLGGDGDDMIMAGGLAGGLAEGGNDSVDGGNGIDIVVYDYRTETTAITFTATGASGTQVDPLGGTDILVNIEEMDVYGGSAGDTFTGDAMRNIFFGAGGNDTLAGGGGADSFAYRADLDNGIDRITDFTRDADDLSFDEMSLNTQVLSGDDATGLLAGQVMVGSYQGGVTRVYVGTDSVAGADIAIDLVGNFRHYGFEVQNEDWGSYVKYYGPTEGNDTLVADDTSDSFEGLGGDDYMDGAGGNDSLDGGAGNDTILGGAGQDTLIGGAGNDSLDGGVITDTINVSDLNVVRFDGATTGVVVNLATGTAQDGQGGTDTLANINFVVGTQFDDSLTGTANGLFEQFEGGEGNDTIDGGAVTATSHNRVNYASAIQAVQVDLAAGTAVGQGNDTLANISFVRGSNFADTLQGSDTTAYTEIFDGRGGNDTIDGRGGNDQYRTDFATTGANVNLMTGVALDGQGGTDTLLNIEYARGGNFNDTLIGNDGANSLQGMEGADVLTGNGGNDTLAGGNGADVLAGGAGDDLIDGGGNNLAAGELDIADYSNAGAALNVNITTGVGTGEGNDTLAGIEGVRGGAFGDVLTGNDGENFLRGNGGNDTLDGAGGFDWADYKGATGGVTVNLATGGSTGADGNDVFTSIEAIRGSNFTDNLVGDGGNNFIRALGGNDTIDGGAGFDTADYREATGAVTASLLTNTSSGAEGADALLNIEALRGGLGNDSLTGNDFANKLDGMGGNDTLLGGGGADTLYGSDGDDLVDAGDGDDNDLRGGLGNDTLLGGAGNDYIFAGAGEGGADSIDGGDGYDVVNYSLQSNGTSGGFFFSSGSGTAARSQYDGNGSYDTLVNIEEVHVFGSNLNDTIFGDGGRNWIQGNGGNDTLSGNGGDDTFSFDVGIANGVDRINDLNIGDGLSFNQFNGPLFQINGIQFGDDAGGLLRGDVMIGGVQNGITKVYVGTDATSGADIVVELNGFFNSSDFGFFNDSFGARLQYGMPKNLVGGDGNDSFFGGELNDTLVGNGGDDFLGGNGGNDFLDGGAGNDNLFGNTGNDYVFGGEGNDYIGAGGTYDGGSDTLDGGAGNDIAAYDFTNAFGPVNFQATGATGMQADPLGGVDTLYSIEEVHAYGSAAGDTIVGDGQRNYFKGNGGDDTLTGGGGNDSFAYDPSFAQGVDRITDFSPQDDLSFQNFTIGTTVLAGDDATGLAAGQLMVGSTLDGVTRVYVGTDDTAGADLMIDLAGSFDAANFQVHNEAWGTYVTYFVPASGVATEGDDSYQGSSGGDFFNGLGGNDTIDGGWGGDTLIGGPGNDLLSGGEGDDYITAGGDFDGGSDTVDGGSGNDVVAYNFSSATTAVTFTSTLPSGVQVDPNGGTDTLMNVEEAHLFGGSAADTLGGDSGRNFVMGNAGNDTLTGGGGNDSFAYDVLRDNGIDRITDLSAGDNLSFQAMTLSTTILSGDDATGLASGQVMVGGSMGGVTRVYIGTDGTAGGDLTIELVGSFSATDFTVYNGDWGASLHYNGPTQPTEGNDTLFGSAEADIINALGGNDVVDGLGGDDILYGGAGNDTLTGGSGRDAFAFQPDQGPQGVDRITDLQVGENLHFSGLAISSIAAGGGSGLGLGQVAIGAYDSGTDTTRVYVGTDTVGGADVMVDLTGNYTSNQFSYSNNSSGALLKYDLPKNLVGDSGNNYLEGADLNDTLTGNGGDDYLDGKRGNDLVSGGDGNDYIVVGGNFDGGSDTVDGGAGNDVVLYNYSYSTTAVNFLSTAQSGTQVDPLGGTDTLSNIEEVHVQGGSAGDTLQGDGLRNFLQGNGGNDTLTGGGGNDSFVFNSMSVNGTDRITDLSAGDDLFIYNMSLNTTVLSGDNASGLTFGQVMVGSTSGGVTRVYVGTDGNAGADLVVDLQGSYSTSGFTVYNGMSGGSLFYNGAGGSTTEPTAFNDTLTGTAGADFINALDGADVVSGLGGNDTLYGGAGNDSLSGGEGDDRLNGGAGNDTIDGGAGGIDTVEYDFGASGSPVRFDSALSFNQMVSVQADGMGGTDSLSGIEEMQVFGSAGADTLNGGVERDFLEGRGGNDILSGGGSSDTFAFDAGAGPLGIDRIADLQAGENLHFRNLQIASVAAGNGATLGLGQVAVGTYDAGTNTTRVYVGTDSVGGADLMIDLSGNVRASDFHIFNDTHGNLFYQPGATQTGTAGNDLLNGTQGGDTLSGVDGNDTLNGGEGNDLLLGGAGTDILSGNLGDDTIDGGTGDGDFAGYGNAQGPVTVNLTTGVATGGDGSDVLLNIDNVGGSGYNDLLIGNAAGNSLSGEGGNDTLVGNDGDDFLTGGFGNDSLDGGAGNDFADFGWPYHTFGINVNLTTGLATGVFGTDTLAGIENILATAGPDQLTGDAGNNYIDGREGNDSINGMAGDDNLNGGAGDDTMDGGAGIDNVTYFSAAGAVTVNLSANSANGDGADTLLNIENIGGSNFGDSLTGNALNNFIDGGSGNDAISGLDGNDFLQGGLGDDTLDGGNGAADFATYFNATGGVTVSLVTNKASGAAGNDTLLNIEDLEGSALADSLTGDDGANELRGGGGNDTLVGNGGNDFLAGGAGNDLMFGGAGRDGFNVGGGNDTMDGGAILDRINYTDLNSVSYAGAGAINLNLATGVVQDGMGGTDTLVNINFVTGSAFGDVLVGSSTLNMFEQFEGGAGDDTIDGGAVDARTLGNTNRASYATASGAVTVSLATGTSSGAAGNDVLLNIQQVTGSAFGDVLTGSNSSIPEEFEAGAGNDTIDGQGGIDVARYNGASSAVNVNLAAGTASDGLGGTDTLVNIEGVRGSNFNDTLVGGNAAHDALEVFIGNAGNDFIDGGRGFDRVQYNSSTSGVVVTLGGSANGTASDGLGGTDTLVSIEGVRGSAFNDTLTGSESGFEVFDGREGSDVIDGRGGWDTAVYLGNRADYTLTFGGGKVTVQGDGAADTVSNIEKLSFADGTVYLYNNAQFDALRYTASNADLIGAFGLDTDAAAQHYFSSGAAEGRPVNFDALTYVASNADLIGAFGTDVEAATRHYISSGYAEGRHATGFDAIRYLAANTDVLSVLGANTAAATQHYVASGYAEGRTLNFDALRYVASNNDLIGAFGTDVVAATSHYVHSGFSEGRQVNFDALAYVASYADLIGAFGTNANAATVHYVSSGFAEGRRATFSAMDYLASNEDLIGAFGTNTAAATSHYIQSGFAEGRGTHFDALGYLAANTDLLAGLGADTAAATRHYVASGYAEGRTHDFDALRYVASNNDLIGAFGTDVVAATSHYVHSGFTEGRQVNFDALNYVASYGDLIGAFGTDADAATRHYIGSGYAEGRRASFDANSYLAANTDLLGGFGPDTAAATRHYVASGYAEGRSIDFDALRYVASHADLITSVGLDTTAATSHYVHTGFQAGYSIDFDAMRYVASYADLIDAFGSNASAATRHYVASGYNEGRTASFDTVQYALGNADLLNYFQFNQSGLATHYVQSGHAEGRSATLAALQGSDGADSLTGGAEANLLNGLAGDDVLNGGAGNDLLVGGAGADTLTGGDGVDVFEYLSAGEGGDSITDFTSGTDKLAFDAHSFGLAVGSVDASHFAATSAGLGNHAGFVYDAATGALGFDADGAGAGAATQIASLGDHHALTAADLFVIG